MQNVLIVEDGKDFQIVIRKTLDQETCRMTTVETVKDAIDALETEIFDLIVLDISLPDGDGFQVCSHLQTNARNRNVPVVFLTANENVSTKVAAFAMGAEDYIVKPFNPMEFKARVDAKLKKARSRDVIDQSLIKGQIKIDFLSHKAFLLHDGKEQELNLTPLEFKILGFLTRSDARVLTREEILHSVWGPNVHVFDRTVDTHISSLRKKLAPCGHYIQAVLGSGYSFSPNAAPGKRAS